jgi:hypothetical protein
MKGREMLKLTLVSFIVNGRRIAKFMRLPIGDNGKVYLPQSILAKTMSNYPRGTTVCIG